VQFRPVVVELKKVCSFNIEWEAERKVGKPAWETKKYCTCSLKIQTLLHMTELSRAEGLYESYWRGEIADFEEGWRIEEEEGPSELVVAPRGEQWYAIGVLWKIPMIFHQNRIAERMKEETKRKRQPAAACATYYSASATVALGFQFSPS
jgi:hypothetical protein